MGEVFANYELVNFDICTNIIYDEYREVDEEMAIPVNKEDILALDSLNIEHKYAYDKILYKAFSCTRFFFNRWSRW